MANVASIKRLSQANAYWRASYTPMLGSRQLVEFVVLDIEPLGPAHGKHALAEAQVMMPVSC